MSFIRKGCLRFFIIILVVIGIALFKNTDWILRTIYPIHYQELIQKYSQEYEVDPYLITSIMKNESKFNPEAVSRKDAKGLMQVAPITGEWASEQLNIENYSQNMLFEPELNIKIGVWYLTVLKREFGDNMGTIVAGYNAGNGNVKKWLQDPQYSEDGKTLKEIPFYETKIYQKKVLRDYRIYKKIYKEELYK